MVHAVPRCWGVWIEIGEHDIGLTYREMLIATVPGALERVREDLGCRSIGTLPDRFDFKHPREVAGLRIEVIALDRASGAEEDEVGSFEGTGDVRLGVRRSRYATARGRSADRAAEWPR